MNRFTKFLCNLMVLGVSLGLAIPAVAGPTTPTPTATPTASPTTTPTPEPTCTDRWGRSKFTTVGKGQSPINNRKITMSIVGNIVDPDNKLGSTAHRISVCAGTEVTVAVFDSSEGGTTTITAGGSLTCKGLICTVTPVVTEKFKVVSSDGKDTDRMVLLPKP